MWLVEFKGGSVQWKEGNLGFIWQRCGGLMTSGGGALDSRLSGPGLCAGRSHCFVFLGKTRNSHSTFSIQK